MRKTYPYDLRSLLKALEEARLRSFNAGPQVVTVVTGRQTESGHPPLRRRQGGVVGVPGGNPPGARNRSVRLMWPRLRRLEAEQKRPGLVSDWITHHQATSPVSRFVAVAVLLALEARSELLADIGITT